MNTVAFAPSSRAAQATAWPWLPALAATTPARRSSSISLRLGAVFVAKFEHLPKYLPHRGERVKLPALDLVQQAPQLGVAGDRLLEVRPRAGGGDREHLTGQVLPSPLLEPPVGLEERAVLLDLLPQLGHVLSAHRLGEDDRRLP